jgi:hypothetical protein
MPDQTRLLQALAAAAATAGVVLLLCGPGRKIFPALSSLGTVLGVALGFSVGCAWLDVRPHWPPREDQDRLLLILLPSAVVVELLAALFRRMAWLLRFALAASAGWILLYGSVYLEDLAGPGLREWTPGQAGLILTLLAAVLMAVWVSLVALAQGSGGRVVPLALALACGGSAVTVMLSGYSSGGQLGLPFAAAVGGVVFPSLILTGSLDAVAATGLALIEVFALLVIGRFFGELNTGHAIALFLAPLLCWLPELPLLRRIGLWQRGFFRVALTAFPVVVVLWLAQQKFNAAVADPSTGSQEGSIDDYRSYGK